MYGDKLTQAINIINDYLQQGNDITLYIEGQSLELSKDEPLQFILWNIETKKGE